MKQLKKKNSPLYDDIIKYMCGARCTFTDFECTKNCKFAEGVQLTRKV